MKSPTVQSLKEMRSRGYTCEVVEHWNSFIKRRKDLFGFVDILCVKEGETVGVQTTSRSNVNARVYKITDNENFPILLQAGWRILVHGWSKKGAKGKRKVYVIKEIEL